MDSGNIAIPERQVILSTTAPAPEPASRKADAPLCVNSRKVAIPRLQVIRSRYIAPVKPRPIRLKTSIHPASFKRPRGRKLGSSNVAERPPAIAWSYYPVRSRAEWAALSGADKRRLSHIARIEEDAVLGEPRVPACARCASKGLVCRQYKKTARVQHEGKSGVSKCGRCRYDGQKCESQVQPDIRALLEYLDDDELRRFHILQFKDDPSEA